MTKVMIYEDPITHKIEEGIAELIKFIKPLGRVEGGAVESWTVRFDSDGFTGQRRILRAENGEIIGELKN